MGYKSRNYEAIIFNSETLNLSIEPKHHTIFSSRYLENDNLRVFNPSDLININKGKRYRITYLRDTQIWALAKER